jgi:hypothetical protein
MVIAQGDRSGALGRTGLTLPAMFRLKPHQLVLATGLVAGAVFAGSGIAPAIVGWHDESPLSREVFGNIPSAVKVLF